MFPAKVNHFLSAAVITVLFCAATAWLIESRAPRVDTPQPRKERITAGEEDPVNERLHRERYEWAKQFVRGKTVADIASGEGYGSEVLREVAASVDEYDYVKFARTIQIDLNRERWTKRYDVIVSFETIEHIASLDFFLQNMRETAGLVLISTPINESAGFNPNHIHRWNMPYLHVILRRFFKCEYYEQGYSEWFGHKPGIRRNDEPSGRQMLGVCTPRS